MPTDKQLVDGLKNESTVHSDKSRHQLFRRKHRFFFYIKDGQTHEDHHASRLNTANWISWLQSKDRSDHQLAQRENPG